MRAGRKVRPRQLHPTAAANLNKTAQRGNQTRHSFVFQMIVGTYRAM